MSRSVRTGTLLAIVVLVVAGCGRGPGPAAPSGPGSTMAPATPAATPTGELPSPTNVLVTPSPALTPPPTAEPSSVPIPPLTRTFRSPTMGYTVRYPAGWNVIPATELWLSGAPDNFDAANGDRIVSMHAGFRGGSQPLAPGQTAPQWIDAYMATQDPTCGQFREQIPLGRYWATIG